MCAGPAHPPMLPDAACPRAPPAAHLASFLPWACLLDVPTQGATAPHRVGPLGPGCGSRVEAEARVRDPSCPSTAGTGWVTAPQGGLHVLEGPADPTLHCCGGWGGLGDGAFGARTVALGPECGAVSSLGSARGGAWWLPDPSGAAQGPGLRSLVQCPRRGPWKGRDLGSPLPEALDSFFKQNQTQNHSV